MGMGHVPQEPIRPEGTNFQFQRRERRRTAPRRSDRSRQGVVSHNQSFGAWGEDLVAEWYRKRGYEVVERNWRCRQGEIDIIASRDSVIVICEVKTRATADFGSPALAVDANKQQRLRRLAAHWLSKHPNSRVAVRFDVAAVVGPKDKVALEVIEAAF
jgi:putative endonuclease